MAEVVATQSQEEEINLQLQSKIGCKKKDNGLEPTSSPVPPKKCTRNWKILKYKAHESLEIKSSTKKKIMQCLEAQGRSKKLLQTHWRL